MLYIADIWQNFTLGEVKLENQKITKRSFHPKVKKANQSLR